MVPTEQSIIDREVPRLRLDAETGCGVSDQRATTRAAERAARESLRAQVAKLERELSGVVAGHFPHVSPGSDVNLADLGSSHVARPSSGRAGPRLLSLEDLERLRDRLVVRLRGAQLQAGQRSELETRSRELLERMREEPGRYKFVRLPVTDLGERGCGVWEVRPRLGLLGMLAGWWQLTLSSGCPLPRPRASGARLSRRGATQRRASRRVFAGCAALLPAHNSAGPRVVMKKGGRPKGARSTGGPFVQPA